jgi:hypothetical protein
MRALQWLGTVLVLIGGVAACDTSGPEEGEDPSPLAAAEGDSLGTWTFVEVEGAVCSDGSQTGLGVRLQEDPDGLLIWFAAGGVCAGDHCPPANGFDTGNAGNRFDGDPAGIFDDRREENNPVANYDIAYVPNCNHDLHSGSRPDASVTVGDSSETHQLVGHRNVERYAELLAPYFSERVDQVVAYGSSAGGFGSVFAYPAMAEAFAPQPVNLITESGPLPKDEDVLPPVLQQSWREVWNLNAALPPRSECPDCYGPEGGGLWNLYSYFADAYPEATFGLVTSEEDPSIRSFFEAGLPSCTEEQPEGCQISADEYRQAVRGLRSELSPERWATYYTPGDQHTFAIHDSSYYDTTTDGVPLTRWISHVLSGETPRVSAP